MPANVVVTDRSLAQFMTVSEEVSKRYAGDLEGWAGSPFAWLLALPSRSRGAAGEAIVQRWLESNGVMVTPPKNSDSDRTVNGRSVEIKFSTLWKAGGYTFQQLRNQTYDYVFCLGVSPKEVHAWYVPKAVILHPDHSKPQHGGSAGVDTRWLTFSARNPPPWMRPYGGLLSEVLPVVLSAK